MFRSSSEFSSSPFKEEEEEQKKNKIAMLAFVLLFSLGLIAPVLCQTAPTPSTCNEMKTVTAANSFIFKSAGVIPRRVAGKCSVEYKLGNDCEAIGVECNSVNFRDNSANCNRGRFLGLVSEGTTTKYCGGEEVDYSTGGDVTLQYFTLRYPLRPIECTVSCKRPITPNGQPPACACGTPTTGTKPWLVSVQKENGPMMYDHVCSGTLIGKKWIMTAATCFQEDDDTANYKILFGANANATTGHKAVDRIESHPLFQDFGNFSVHNLALVRLEEESTNTPICWPSQPDNSTEIITTGWGNIDANETLSQPMEGTLTTVVQAACQESYGNATDFTGDNLMVVCSMICAENQDFCNADFGSPGMGLINSTHVELLGVASFTGDEDCMDVPGVFSDTYAEQYWWKEIVGYEPECVPAI